jgi:pantothenate kinase-related protein Tda10
MQNVSRADDLKVFIEQILSDNLKKKLSQERILEMTEKIVKQVLSRKEPFLISRDKSLK